MNTIIFEGYLAELIGLQAEQRGMSAEEYILSFFDGGVQCTSEPGAVSGRTVHCT